MQRWKRSEHELESSLYPMHRACLFAFVLILAERAGSHTCSSLLLGCGIWKGIHHQGQGGVRELSCLAVC